MIHKATIRKPVDVVIQLLDEMPKERRTDYVAGKLAPSIVGRRTFTRVDGNKFQISRTAGLGSAACCTGIVASEGSNTIINLRTTFGIIPNAAYVALALFLGALSIDFYMSDEYLIAGFCLALAATTMGYRSLRLFDAKCLRQAVSEQLGGVEWKRAVD